MDIYISPTHGPLSLSQVRDKVLEFMKNGPDFKYSLVIGSDSEPREEGDTEFVTAFVIRRIGAGGVYFWKRTVGKKKYVFRTRIYEEATLSLMAANEFLDTFKNDGISKFDLEIHVDIGEFGKTREMLSEIIGMVRGSGFNIKTKPYSYGASKIADRHT
ncbi:MAG: hypothetical protein UU37_C0003G0010 [Candidatus Gottesmanbacteria bacterium GW2011_GWA2_41_12]|uniref:DUF458 domain-containing protein n=2 Tax=Candidatus Gottesmaniibacteriota TaxID=1752720 RepID=A0A0G0ULN6_9BACT|nr:MAG: hypothetical protein UT63_C0014G0005 [Candidatus Gottesmanbacteria bacterium GW2011_GWC2_39_8]KKR88436.1 MAG: hypothetical protein UU37_C0003G0010 [Candidatus Gottesmanbacteria bacterium GW2011_GWA2_41_12]